MSRVDQLSLSPPSSELSTSSSSDRLRRLPNLDLSSLDLNDGQSHTSPNDIVRVSSEDNNTQRYANDDGLQSVRRGSVDNPQAALNGDTNGVPKDSTAETSLSARYLTVSAVLSRSGRAIPLSELPDSFSSGSQARGLPTINTKVQKIQKRGSQPQVTRRQTFAGQSDSKAKAASNGSALEALGALLLQRDSSGKVSNLSFTRYREGNSSGGSRFSHGLSRVSRAFLQGIREAGAARLGIEMPEKSGSGHTIAQRRARKQGFNLQNIIMGLGSRKVSSDVSDDESFERVGTKPWHPSFEVSRTRQKQEERHTFLPIDPSTSTLVSEAPPDLILSPSAFANANAFKTDHLANGKTKHDSAYGIGSAFSHNDPLEAPPSPVAMPGGWSVGASGVWGSRSGDWSVEGALLLPPPLLDDFGSDAKSFEGLLGVRRMREQEKARKELEKLKARNRPAHKTGMLTAFSNFVKAAHAADRASKAAQRSAARPSDSLLRRHTEPINHQQRGAGQDQKDALPIVDYDDESDDELEAESEVKSSIDIGSQHMMRVSSQGRKSIDASGRSLDTVFEGVASQEGSTSAIATPSDMTRRSSLALSRTSSRHSQLAPKAPRLLPIYMSVTSPTTPFALDSSYDSHNDAFRRYGDSSEPPTPRLGPTMLSLPPSPWVSANTEEHLEHEYSLNLTVTPMYGPPGTPRLAPTALEINPSPFPISPTFSPFVRSYQSASRRSNKSTSSVDVTSPLALSPQVSPLVTPVHLRKRNIDSTIERDDDRLTPLALMEEDGRQHRSAKQDEKEVTALDGAPTGKSEITKTRRSFFLWFLFGDLGLGTRSKIAAKASGSPLPSNPLDHITTYGVLIGLIAHTYAFSIFLLAHLVDLAYRIGETLSMTFWFLRWMFLNFTGQTVLARCIIEAYQLVRKEWQIVSKEDHEEKGDKMSKGGSVVIGLSRWQVIKGMIELFCLQDVTRDRYLEEGAGLEELKGWRRSKKALSVMSPRDRIDIGVERSTHRRNQISRDAKEIGSDGSDRDESDSESESDSDDDEMVVTRQGPDILEFTKTPRVEYREYFSHMHSESPKEEKRKLSRAKAEDNRSMVKTIKWASRLAISAYGLHVTLVDLPPTFTPSGNRFSRQTFAHLSRLHHEDVLHADIQTLDSDAYSPTFYLVRDLTRKVVIVSVRGTQSLQDIIVDLEMTVNEVKLDGDICSDEEKLYCHAGVLRAAKALIEKDSTLFKTLNVALLENPGFGIVFTGHSLGGAIASTVVLLLGKYISAKKTDEGGSSDEEGGVWVTHNDSGLPAGRTIRAITFAHPTTVNATLANRAALGKIPLVLSVVLGSDIIPRCGHGQARELRRVLGGLSRVRKRKGDLFHPHRKSLSKEDARIHIVTSWWRWKMIQRKESPTKDQISLAKRIESELWSLRCDVENDLYAAIKQRSSLNIKEVDNGEEEKEGFAANLAGKRDIPPSPWVGPDERSRAPLHQLASRRQELDAITIQNEESILGNGILVPAGQSILIHKNNLYRITSPLSFFSLPDLHPRMFAEHFPSAYETALLEDIRL